MLARKQELVLAAVVCGLAALTLLVWIPNDISTGIVVNFRHETSIGDSFIPVLSAGAILVSAMVHLVMSFRRPHDEPDNPYIEPVVSARVLPFLATIAVMVAVSLVVMFWAGPFAAWLLSHLGAPPFTYHQVRQIAPWKYIGFALGGFVQVLGIISVIEGRISASRVLISLVAVVLIILVFGVFFGNILLPPNGDW